MSKTEKIGQFIIPSIADIIFISLFLFLSFYFGDRLLLDGDTGYHVRAGEYIIETFSIPKQDIFSFRSPPLHWTAHEWLSEVIMAMAHRTLGLTGVVIFFSFIISMVPYLLFKIFRADNNNLIIISFVVILVMSTSYIHWLARPHIFSLLLMVIWYYLLDEYQYHHKNYLYLLPPIMLLWVNLHGGFLTGFILIGIYLFGNVVKYVASKDTEKDHHKKKIKLLGMTGIACLVVSLINPYGYHILLFPFNMISNDYLMNHVSEFLSPNFHRVYVKPFEFYLLFMLAIYVFSKKRMNIIELMMILLFTHMSFFSARYIPLFGIIAAPILLRPLNSILVESDTRLAKFLKKKSDNISEIDASAKGYLWLAAPVVLVFILAASGTIEYQFDKKRKPVAAVEFLKKENLKGHMFDNDEFGDYIIYAAWPQYKVFFDGRSDMYGVDRLKEYFKVTKVNSGWDKLLNKYNITWIIYNANSPLSLFLVERDDWKLIYADKVASIFVKNIPENQYLIEKYPDVKLVIDEDKDEEK